jgi:hypothetical protein
MVPLFWVCSSLMRVMHIGAICWSRLRSDLMCFASHALGSYCSFVCFATERLGWNGMDC